MTRSDNFASAVALHRPLLLRLAMLQLGDMASAEDAVQETLLAALAGEDRFEKRSSLKTWLISILRYKILDAIRARCLMRARCAPAVAHDDQDGDLEIFDDLFDEAGCWSEQKDVWIDPQTAAEQTAFFKVLEACLTRLPERTSRAFLMREWLESEPDEICSALGVTHGNLRVLLYRARMQLRHCLDVSWER